MADRGLNIWNLRNRWPTRVSLMSGRLKGRWGLRLGGENCRLVVRFHDWHLTSEKDGTHVRIEQNSGETCPAPVDGRDLLGLRQ